VVANEECFDSLLESKIEAHKNVAAMAKLVINATRATVDREIDRLLLLLNCASQDGNINSSRLHEATSIIRNPVELR
jgi:hypothetical protein